MSISKWKELAQKKTAVGKMKKNLYDEITAEKIRSKTTDQAIAKAFRLDRLDQIAEQTKPKAKRQVRFQIPRVNRDDGIDYAPDVDPYEDMDVEGLLNLEDYVAPQAEKQIAKIPKEAPKYEMDPSFWQLPSGQDPPPLYEEKDPLAISDKPWQEPEDEDEDEDEEDLGETANKILDQLDLPNYNDVEMRMNEPEMTVTKQKIYLQKVVKDAEMRRKQLVARKSNATKDFNAGKITEAEKEMIHKNSDFTRNELNVYKKHYQSKLDQIKPKLKLNVKKFKKGSGAYFFNDAKEMLQKLTLIIAEMEAGNTSIQMRNMGQTILDALLHSKKIFSCINF